MNLTHASTFAALLLPSLNTFALTLEVERFANGQPLPFGYQEVIQTGIDPAEVIKVSEAPYIDYMIPNNQGSSGITAQKQGGQFLTGTNAADPGGGFLGANNYPDPDRWHVVFEWTDGLPLPFSSDYYGVSHSGWSATAVSNLITRVDLASTETLTIYHWFNDGWDYNNHTLLDGHVLTVTQYAADGNTVDSASVLLPSGGAEAFFGDHRQFYTSTITATATGEGDFLIISNEGANVGYKGTAVAILDSGTPKWLGFDVSEAGDANSLDWLGWVNVNYAPWIWAYNMDQYVFIEDASGWIYAQGASGGASGDAMWLGYAVNAAGDANAEGWLGWVNVAHAPWVWSYAMEKFIFVEDASGWFFVQL